MKNLKAPFLVLSFILLSIQFVSAGTTPPPPQTARTMSAASEDCGSFEFCNDPVPIDDNIYILLICGLVLGSTVIYKHKMKKASI